MVRNEIRNIIGSDEASFFLIASPRDATVAVNIWGFNNIDTFEQQTGYEYSDLKGNLFSLEDNAYTNRHRYPVKLLSYQQAVKSRRKVVVLTQDYRGFGMFTEYPAQMDF